MATPVLSPSAFINGEISPSLWGHADLQRTHAGAATARNMFCRVQGGLMSRGGTKFIDYSIQVGKPAPPRLIPFQFSLDQGRILEFGDFAMHVFIDGEAVVDLVEQTDNATQTNPLTVTVFSGGAGVATPINSGVISSYRPGEVVTLAGGTFTVPAQVEILTTALSSIAPQRGAGAGYAPGDSITLAGGAPSVPAQVLVIATQVNSATVAAGGSGGPVSAIVVVTGTTGHFGSSPFRASVLTDSTGAIQSVLSISSGGLYTVNPTVLSAEPVTGGGLSGATLSLTMGPQRVSVPTAGIYFTNPPGGAMSQASTTGSGTGAVFNSALFGGATVTLINSGSYSVFPTNPVVQASSTAGGLGIQFNMNWTGGLSPFNVGDWILFEGVGGMTQINGETLVVASGAAGVYTFNDVFGRPVDATTWGAYTSSGTASRIFTAASPYSEDDLKWLKFTQSADVMSICCVNQTTLTEYPPYDLRRLSDANWIFTQFSTAETISAPGACSLSATFNWTLELFFQPGQIAQALAEASSAAYAYCVTAVNPNDGTESVASPVGALLSAVDISATQGTITVSWPPVSPPANATGQVSYNVYKATPISSWGFVPGQVPIGALFGFAGTALGTSFQDANITADFSQTPPFHYDPFARGQIVGFISTGFGTGEATAPSVTINTSTGSGGSIIPIVQGGGYPGATVVSGFEVASNAPGPVVGAVILDPGQNYQPGDTVTINDGAGATASITIGPLSGTYPSVPAYFQERRVYANTLNNPDTYWMSVTGNFMNFDSRIPTIADDAITGSPMTSQVNGIQWLVQQPGGLLALTGLGAWQIGGPGSSPFNPQAITPEGQFALPEVFNGASPTVPPIRIDQDILYVQAKGSRYRDLVYQFFTNIYTGRDITINSTHLFDFNTIIEHAWQEEPYKLLWSIRDDGVLLSLTFYRPEEALGWTRHDTWGKFASVASITEPPVDAVYFAVQRPIGPNGSCVWTIERMDDRLWSSVEDVWAVDCGLRLPMPEPNAWLNISSPDGVGTITGLANVSGGQNYGSATFATVVDNNGLGSGTGAAVAVNVGVGGVLTFTIVSGGAGYVYPQLVIQDPSGQGSGASATFLLSTQASFLTGNPVFGAADVLSVLRVAGGVAVITVFVSPFEVLAELQIPVSSYMNDGPNIFIPNQKPGSWTLTAPVSVIGGLAHLAGQTVTGLADGQVVTPRAVSSTGTVTLDKPASAVTIGLQFTAQAQSLYLDTGEPTVQGQRKKIGNATVRLEASGDVMGGANQPDGSTMSPMQLAPQWSNLTSYPNPLQPPYAGGAKPLFTGDIRVPVQGGTGKPGQVAIEQRLPLPMNILAIIPEALAGDTPEQRAQPKQRGGGGAEG